MSERPAVPVPVGIVLALIQFFFTLTWIMYVIYLPTIAARVGIPAAAVIFILMLDQAIFALSDFAAGVAADRVARTIGRLGRIVASITLMSSLAFVALPLVSGGNSAAIPLFFVLTFVWTITSSALRAPPLMLLGKYAARPTIPMLSGLAMFGFGLAGAAAPYLALTLREIDPRWPFVLASVAVVLAACGLSHVERSLASQADIIPPKSARAAGPLGVLPIIFALGMLMLALGHQLHFAINTAPLFRKFTDTIDALMPVFWIGFNVAMFPASLLVKRWGGFVVMGLFGVVGAFAIIAAETASSLNILIAAQLAAGAAWGCILMSGFSALQQAGRMAGILFSALALATFTRLTAVAAGVQRDSAGLLQWAPTVCWMIAGALLLYVGLVRMRRWMEDAVQTQ
jgi:hypothetical protein